MPLTWTDPQRTAAYAAHLDYKQAEAELAQIEAKSQGPNARSAELDAEAAQLRGYLAVARRYGYDKPPSDAALRSGEG